jgi:DNA repair exonuclease SbcCD nuclease subunit
MSSILFVGDPHLDSVTPLSRLDNYRETTLAKLRDILLIASAKRVKYVIMTGDVFDKLDQSLIYIHELLDVFNLFKENGIEVYTVVGNHDLKYNSFNYFSTTPLSLLFKTGAVKHLEILDIPEHNTRIYGVDFTKESILSTYRLDKSVYNIVVVHYGLENTVPGESIPFKNLKKFNLVVAGHDHMAYPIHLYGNTTMLRPGSMTRRTKDEYNLTRDVSVYVVDLETKNMLAVPLPSARPAKDIFKYTSFIEAPTNFFSSSYNELFAEDYFAKSVNSLTEMIDSLPPTVFESTKEAIYKYLKDNGLIKTTV